MLVKSDIVGPTQPPHILSRQAFTVNITPQSNHASAQPNPEEDKKVEDVNVYLSEDIKGRIRLSIEDFLDVILRLPPSEYDKFARETRKRNSKGWPAFDSARDQYEKICKDSRKRSEKCLYEPLVKMLNTAMTALFSNNSPLLFYDGSESSVRGSYTDRKPDLGVLSRKTSVDKSIVESMHKYWFMLLYFVEVKRRKGVALDRGPITMTKEAKAVPSLGTETPLSHGEASSSREDPGQQKNTSRSSNEDRFRAERFSSVWSFSQPASSLVVDDAQSSQRVGTKRKRPAPPNKRESSKSGRSSDTVDSQYVTSQASTSALAAAQPAQHRYPTRSRSVVSALPQSHSSMPAQASTSSHQTTHTMSTSDSSSTLAEVVANRTEAGTTPVTPPRQQDDYDESGDQKRRKGEQGSKIPITDAEGETQAEGAPEVDSIEIPVEEEDKLDDTQIVTHTLLQCAGYGLEMLSAGTMRNHSIGMVIDDHFLQIAYYDRSKIVLSEPVDFFDDQGRMRLLATLHQLGKLSRWQCGPFADASSSTGRSTGCAFPRISPAFNIKYLKSSQDRDTKKEAKQVDVVDGKLPGYDAFSGCRLTLKKGIQFDLQEIIYRAHGVIGRGSTVFRARCSSELKSRWNHDKEEVIVKISFPGAKREAENMICRKAIKKAEELGDDHLWVKNNLPKILYSATFKYGRNMPQSRLRKFLGKRVPYELRKVRITVQELLEPVTDLNDAVDYGQVFLDILQVHRWLVDYPKILHRDISLANIMFRRKDRVYGVLNDFDLASSLPPGTDPSSRQRTGTKPFMSHELLDINWSRGHFYRHDLEALFYTVLITCCHHEMDKSLRVRLLPRHQRPYYYWYIASNRGVYDNKFVMMLRPPEGPLPVTKFFQSLKGHVARLLSRLNIGYNAQSGYLSQARALKLAESDELNTLDSEDAVEDFDWYTLNNHVTYESFKRILSSSVAGRALVVNYNNPLPLNPKDFEPQPKEDITMESEKEEEEAMESEEDLTMESEKEEEEEDLLDSLFTS